MSAIVTFLYDDKVYLLTMKEKNVRKFESVEEGLAYFEKSYNRKHAIGYVGSITASLNFITFQPSVHEWNHETVSLLVEQDVIVMDTACGYEFTHETGRISGGLCTGEKALEFHHSGKVPQLI